MEIIETKEVYRGFFRVQVTTLRHRPFSGAWSEYMRREIMDRGHAVVVIPYDPIHDQIVMLEQFRVGAIASSPTPWLRELVAGMVDPGETKEDVVSSRIAGRGRFDGEVAALCFELSVEPWRHDRTYLYLSSSS